MEVEKTGNRVRTEFEHTSTADITFQVDIENSAGDIYQKIRDFDESIWGVEVVGEYISY